MNLTPVIRTSLTPRRSLLGLAILSILVGGLFSSGQARPAAAHDGCEYAAHAAAEWWSAARGDHFFVGHDDEAGRLAAKEAGYTYVRWSMLYTPHHPQPAGTVPLKLFWSAERGDNFSTASFQGEQDALAAGYTFVRIQGYVYPNYREGYLPLKQYWSAARGDNFLTSYYWSEQDALAAGYTFVRIEGWVWYGGCV